MKLTCFAFLFLCLSNLYAQDYILHREIDQIIRYDTDIKYPIEKSFIIGIIKGDSTWVLNFGPEHIDTLDKFEIGGLTKVFTSTLALKLAEEQLIDLDQAINIYLPENFQNDRLSDYKLSDLLLHQIPFPKRPNNLALKEYDISNPYKYYTKMDLLNYYATYKPVKKSIWGRGQLNYSHVNFALLEVILENEMQMPLEDLFQFYLFQDLKMNDTSLNFPENQIKIGYDRSNMIPETWKFESFAGSEGLTSCLLDLLIFTNHLLQDTSEFVLRSLEPRERARISKRIGMSYSWYILDSKKTGMLYTHSGTTERHKAYIHFKPESQSGVVILSQSSEGVGELGMLILRLINKNWR